MAYFASIFKQAKQIRPCKQATALALAGVALPRHRRLHGCNPRFMLSSPAAKAISRARIVAALPGR